MIPLPVFFDKEKKKNRFFKQLCDVPETRKRPFSIIYICRIICIMYSYCFIDNGLINKRKILKQAPKKENGFLKNLQQGKMTSAA